MGTATSFLTRLLGSKVDAPHKKCVVCRVDHDWGVGAQALLVVHEIIFENRKKLPLPSMRDRADPRNRRSSITLLWQCRARLAGAFELERESRLEHAATSPKFA